MKPLVITVPHRLTKDEAVQRLKSGLSSDRSGDMLTVDEQVWNGDHCNFCISAMGQSISGGIDVTDQNVRLEVQLPWLLATMADQIRGTIERKASLMLEKK